MKLISNEYKPVLELVAHVGKNLVTWQNDETLREIHSEENFKTEADYQAHQILTKGLSELFPQVPIISEEDSFHDNQRPEKYWLIDPIDGTASWYGGYKGFVSQAALIINARPVFGVIHAPRFKSTWCAQTGKGAFLNGALIQKLFSHDRLMFIDNTPEPHGITKKLMDSFGSKLYLECGSIGLKSVLVADGSVDVFVKDVEVRDWDLAPVDVILSEVGGCICLLNGDRYLYEGSFKKENGFIISRNHSLMSKIVESQK